MPVDLTIVESTTELGQTVVEVVLESASTPGPAGPGVPTGGTDGQVLTKTAATDYATAWEDPTGGAGGAPDDATYLVTAAHADLSAEVVVGAAPGGELGGTWAAPTVDATHSGSSHAAVQAAAEATAAAALSSHEGDTTSVHGIADTSVLATDAEVATAVSDHSADTTSVHGIADTSALALTANAVMDGDAAGGVLSGTYPSPGFAADMATQAELDAHVTDTSAAHAASAVSADSTTLSGVGTDVQAVLEELDNLLDDHSARHENGGADEISLAGLSGTSEALQAHLDDAADAHDASAISVADAGGFLAATDVEAALAEVAEAVYCKASHNTTQTAGNATWKTLDLNTDSDDEFGMHDPATNNSRITIPTGKGGVYVIDGQYEIEGNATGGRFIRFTVSGSEIAQDGPEVASSAFANRVHMTTSARLAAGDYVEIAAWQNSGGDRTIAAGCFLSVVRIGA